MTLRRRLACCLLLLLPVGCGQGEPPPADPGPAPSPRPGVPAAFVDVTAASGVDFTHDHGATARRYLPETMGSGVALLDYDGDGLLDVYLVNGGPVADPAAEAVPGRLYRNLGDGSFADVTARAGLDVGFVGMGAAVGDVDNDGDLDLLVTSVGPDRLFRNAGDGRFVHDGPAGSGAPGFGSSAAFLDADGDGWLDLFAGRYVEWSPEEDVECRPDGTHLSYCTPEVYDGAVNRFYRNRGDGALVDATEDAGLAGVAGKTLGVVTLDADADGRTDLAVANDTDRNLLLRNRGDGTFEEVGASAGVALGPSGSPRGSMGIDAGDLTGDGLTDLVVGNFSQEMSALFRASPTGVFVDDGARLGIGLPSLMTLAFGTLSFDYDRDGWLDVLLLNGHIEPEIARFQPHQSYAQPATLLRYSAAEGGFAEHLDSGALADPMVGRGLAAGDLDADGDPDLVVTQNGRPARVLRNEAPPSSWLRVVVADRRGGRTPYGAVARVTAGERVLTRELRSGCSYLSACEAAIDVGLGAARVVDLLEVAWPSGRRLVVLEPPVDRVLVVSEPE